MNRWGDGNGGIDGNEWIDGNGGIDGNRWMDVMDGWEWGDRWE